MDSELRSGEHSGDAFKRAIQLQRVGRLEECADALEKAWLEGDARCGDALFDFLAGWRMDLRVAVATRLDRLACSGNDRARATWETWFPELRKILGVSDNMRGLRRVVLEHAERPRESVLMLKAPEGVGRTTAARVLHELTNGSQFVKLDYCDEPRLPPENGTFYASVLEPGAWEARFVDECRARCARLVVGYPPEGEPQWVTLQTLDRVDYVITSLAERREDIVSLALGRFPEWLLGPRDDPDFEHVKTIHFQPDALTELATRPMPFHYLNARGLFYALDSVARRALSSSSGSETLTIGREHLWPLRP